MNWKTVNINSRSIQKITIRKSSIAFSSRFVKDNNLDSFPFVEIIHDEVHQRIGFIFKKIATGNSLPLRQDGGKQNKRHVFSRIIYIELYKQIEWIKTNWPDISEINQSFIPTLDNCFNVNLFYIEFGFPYSGIKNIGELSQIKCHPGVYRLFNDRHEIIRIGEGKDIVKRIVSHLNDSNEIKYFDWFEINCSVTRKQEEKRQFTEFKKSHNMQLPLLNPITL